MSTLLVMENSGDFAQWVSSKTIDGPEDSLFSFKNQTPNVSAARWEVSDHPPFLGGSFGTILGTSNFQPPLQGKAKVINVDWKHLVPATAAPGKKYFFHVVEYAGGNNSTPVFISNTVTITTKKSNFVVKFTPEGLGQTVRQKRPELFDMSPMAIEIDLQKLYIGNPNETHDEPYLIAAVLFVDGTTINPLALSTSTVRIDSHLEGKTLGNVPDVDSHGNDLEQGSTANIPATPGHFDASLVPIGAALAADMEDVNGTIADSIAAGTVVIVMVIAMEEDDTIADAVKAAHKAMVDELQKQANATVQAMTLPGLLSGNTPQFDPENLKDEIIGKVVDPVVDKTLTPGWWTPVLLTLKSGEFFDPDDFVGAAFATFSFGDLAASPPDGIHFELECSNPPLTLFEQMQQSEQSGIPFGPVFGNWEGSYTVRGRIRRKLAS